MKIANILMTWAIQLMPPLRQVWADAMQAEFEAVVNTDRLGFAAGCLWTAVGERMKTVNLWVALGRWGVGAVTSAYAGLHLFGAVWVMSVLLGGHDRYHDLLVAHGHLTAAVDLKASRVWLLPYLLGMGIGNLLAAIFLVWWRPNLFMLGWALVALTVAASMAVVGLTGHFHHGTVYGWQFVPLFLLAGAAAMLAWAANRKKSGVVA